MKKKQENTTNNAEAFTRNFARWACKHCADIKQNAIGEWIVYCDLTGRWENESLGDCIGNCEQQERTKNEPRKIENR